MNFSDSEIVASILAQEGCMSTNELREADIILVNTCSIRDNAEQRVRKRLQNLRSLKNKKPELIIGLLGCMAERLKEKLLEDEPILDIIVGPDAYRDLPRILEEVKSGHKVINTVLSSVETYSDIEPVRYDSNGVSAYISIMRGCENFCSYCVVPYVRGQERSRNAQSIINEAGELFRKGFREITLLGQNVNSYLWKEDTGLINFAGLLSRVADIDPKLRIRFATSHPKDISNELLQTIASRDNICKSIHLPMQSGSTKILEKMNRGYSREQYIERIEAIREIIKGCAISTDIIAGFCDETEEDHQETLALMKWARFDFAYMFRYSERPDTLAAEIYTDNISNEIKERRLNDIISLQQEVSSGINNNEVGSIHEVLVEGYSKRSKEYLFGRNSANKVVVFSKNNHLPGDYIRVRILKTTSATLTGEVV